MWNCRKGSALVEARTTSELIAEGEYYQALGVHHGSTRLEIDTASARLSQEHPELAGVLSGIAQVLTDPAKGQVLTSACQLRDTVVASLVPRFGSDFLEFTPGHRTVIWGEVQKLLLCDFGKGAVSIRPRAAASLAKRGLEWIIESVVNSYLPTVQCSPEEKRGGKIVRTFSKTTCHKCGNKRAISCAHCEGSGTVAPGADQVRMALLADNLGRIDRAITVAQCPDCRGTGMVPCDCTDSYTFRIPPGTAPGSVLVGRGESTNSTIYVLLDRKVVSPRPRALLLFYRAQEIRLPGYGETLDTLEQTESTMRRAHLALPIVWVVFGAVIGLLLGSWQTGAIIALASVFAFLIRLRYLLHWKPQAVRAWLVSLVIMHPALGAFIGTFLGTWLAGAIAGGIMSATFLAVGFASGKGWRWMT